MSASGRGAADLSGGRYGVVPYIASWSGERRRAATVRRAGAHRGIIYADEGPYDRDEHGVLWIRSLLRPGVGSPRFGAVHPARQRRAMRKLLCQVCAEPANRTEEGVLWLLSDAREDWPDWPENMAATHPPVCLPCAEKSRRLCPSLRPGNVAVRVRSPQVEGVFGIRYAPGFPEAVAVAAEIVPYDDARVRWILASQLVTGLHDCTFVDLEAELSARANT